MKVLDVSAPPSKRPRASIDEEWGPDGELDLLAPVLFAWRYRYFVVGATLLAAVLGFLAAVAQPLRYSATAVVYLTSPRTPNPLAPEALTIESLERLATSDVVESRAQADLRQRNLLTAGQSVLAFRPQLHKSAEPGKPYLPMLELTIEATSPELARDAANTWSRMLKEEATRLIAANRTSAVEFIVKEYPKESERLREAEQSLDQFKGEQERALGNVRSQVALSLREARLWSREQLIVDLEDQRHRLLVDLKAAEASVAAIEQELKQVPQMIVVSRSAQTGDAKLQSQQVNPVHTELSQKLAEARVRRSELASRVPALETQIAGAGKEAAGLRSSVEAGERSMAELERQQKTDYDAKERDVLAVRSSFKKLEERIGDATLVANDGETSVTLGSPVEAPGGPSGPHKVRYAGIGGLAGFGLSLLVAWVADRIRREPSLA